MLTQEVSGMPLPLHVPRAVSRLGLLLLLAPATAHAQRVLVTHPPLPSPLLSPSGRFIVAMVDNRFVADDTDQIFDLYRYALDTNVWTRVPRAALIGSSDPSTLSSSSVDLLSISDDGRYVAYVVRRFPATPGEPWPPPVLVWHDLEASVRRVIRDAAFDPFAQPVMSRDGSTLAWVGANNAVLVGTVGQTPVAVGQACAPSASYCPAPVALTARGERVLYGVVDGEEASLEIFERATAGRRRFPSMRFGQFGRLATTSSGRYVLAAPVGMGSAVLDVDSGWIAPLAATVGTMPVITEDGTYVFGTGPGVHDRLLGTDLPVYPFPPLTPTGGIASLTGLSANGRIGLGRMPDDRTVLVDLDGDADGMFDLWENGLGLDATNPGDWYEDPDADGVSNVEEARRRSHPLGRYRRVFAEGVTSDVFDTVLHVYQPRFSLTAPRSIGFVVSYLGDEGTRVSQLYDQFAGGHPPIGPPSSLTPGQYAIEVESEWPIVAERITAWGGPPARGAHGTSGATPGVSWFFAEGATIGGFQLFYLLANPGQVDAVVDVEYLLAQGLPEWRQYVVPAQSRRTVWVNQEGGALGAAELSARIISSEPIVAERAMYSSGPGGFTAGTASMGVATPSRRWLFAEGLTGGVFDTFLLLANPTNRPVAVGVTFRRPEGDQVVRSYAVAAESRRTVWLTAERLWPDATAVSMELFADEPIVAERAMWWRGAGSTGWIEGHTETGGRPALRWVVADMPESAFLLIANAEAEPVPVRITYYTETGGGAASRDYLVPARGRVTAWPVQDNPHLPPGRYRAVVESLPAAGAPGGIVVERSAYDDQFRVGTSYLATPIP